jgi:3-hydroxyacyl-[acyl-carrier-protein] dehydratase
MSGLKAEKIVLLEDGKGAQAEGRVPESAEYFQDHFPGFPILPGVLSLEILKSVAEHCLGAKTRSAVRSVRNVKFTALLRPGDAWECKVERVAREGARSEWQGRLTHAGRMAAAARFVLETES